MTTCRADSVVGKQRFLDEFGPPDDSDDEAVARPVQRPADFKALWRNSNTGDHFRIGIRLTRGSVCCSALLCAARLLQRHSCAMLAIAPCLLVR
jgi:hypothetical protein